MKKIIVFLLVTILLLNSTNFTYADKPDISAEAAILIDAETGQILFEKNIHEKLYPASTTKIMTGILAIENCDLNEIVTVDDKTPYEITGSHIALEPGEQLTLKDLLYALLIESANDAAVVIAKHISGSVEKFAELMNDKAKEIGALNTHFVNPNGLPDENHVTTAYDLAMITKYAMKNEIFRNIVSQYSYKIEPTNKKSEPRYLKSSNELLYSSKKINVDGNWVTIKYDGVNGVKSGYTDAARRCLVTSATRNGQTLISVVLRTSSNDAYIDTHKLLNYGFDNFSDVQVAFKNEFINNIEVENGDIPFATCIVENNLNVTVPIEKIDQIKKNIIMPSKLNSPITKNQVVGRIEYTLDEEILGTVNIVSAIEVNQKPVYKVINDSKNSILKKWWFWVIALGVIWRARIAYKRYKRKKRKVSVLHYNINNH